MKKIIFSILAFLILTLSLFSQGKYPSGCGVVYALMQGGKPVLQIKDYKFQNLIANYYLASEKIQIVCNDIKVHYNEGNTFAYLVIRGTYKDKKPGSRAMAIRLDLKDDKFTLNCNGACGFCSSEGCDGCEVKFKPDGEIQGCTCTAGNVICLSSSMTALPDDLKKLMPFR